MRSFWLDWTLASLLRKWPRFLFTTWIAYIFYLRLLSQSVLKFLHLLLKCRELLRNRRQIRTNREVRPTCCFRLCTVKVTWRSCSTSDLSIRSLKFAGFPNQSPLRPMPSLAIWRRYCFVRVNVHKSRTKVSLYTDLHRVEILIRGSDSYKDTWVHYNKTVSNTEWLWYFNLIKLWYIPSRNDSTNDFFLCRVTSFNNALFALQTF